MCLWEFMQLPDCYPGRSCYCWHCCPAKSGHPLHLGHPQAKGLAFNHENHTSQD
ncbi:hypothetical protein DPEC_G00307820 [Dallia pectoralis]|uniref:Uncharacterized protein n=1 Tax=Dallia pectoralis TaxID=75939 RepID=A0ACC2FEF5_DALPE|nr:hypothetical protein DPEC_G00307820 [Dallia pectoralis]